ncbi:glycosyltransferase family 2 protein [Patescibacteria group bacterium]|nr:glycosyltransferase family 2 protein [Patescibacteria group bacterium]
MSTFQLASLVQGKFPKVSIIILNWNGWQDTLECLDSLTKIFYPNYEVIVIDNNSTNESAAKLKVKSEKLKVEGKNFKLIENKENFGFAGGNNPGIKYAVENKSDYVLLLNNDTIVDPDFLEKLVKAGESDQNFGIIGPKIYYESDKNRIWFGGGYFSWLGGGRHMEYDKIDDKPLDEAIKEVDFMTGCCFLIKREIIEKIGPMNEDFFLYYEDTEWSLRARKNGYKVIYAPSSHIWHKISRSVKPKTNPIVHYYHIRNALLLSKLHAPKIIVGFIYVWSVIKYFKQIVKIIFFPKKKEIAKMIMKGVRDFYAGKFGVYKNSL